MLEYDKDTGTWYGDLHSDQATLEFDLEFEIFKDANSDIEIPKGLTLSDDGLVLDDDDLFIDYEDDILVNIFEDLDNYMDNKDTGEYLVRCTWILPYDIDNIFTETEENEDGFYDVDNLELAEAVPNYDKSKFTYLKITKI